MKETTHSTHTSSQSSSINIYSTISIEYTNARRHLPAWLLIIKLNSVHLFNLSNNCRLLIVVSIRQPFHTIAIEQFEKLINS